VSQTRPAARALTQHLRQRARPLSGLSAAALLVGASSASAASPPAPSVPPGFTITKLATAPKGATNCDDLGYLEGHLFMVCQNLATSFGSGGNSTIVEYADDGSVIATWSVPGKTDGIAGDPLNRRLIVTLNEDGKSRLLTLMPSAPAAQQVTNYTYSVDPGSHTLTGPLHTGGGTDSVSVDGAGHIYTSASYGVAKTGTAVFRVALKPPKAAGSAGTAVLSPTFLENANAATGNTGSGSVQLKLNDVDSTAIVPPSSPRYAGQFVIDDQTALDLVFASKIDSGSGLTVLHTPYGLDDIRWATSFGGTLFVVDKGASPKGISSLYRVAGPFVAGVPYASNDSLGTEVDTVNLTTGKTTPFIRNLLTAKGLVYLDASDSEPVLSLGSPARAASPSGSSVPVASVTHSGTDSDALPTVLAIVALMLALALGALGLARRPGGRTAS
jgi:hypothetical protein